MVDSSKISIVNSKELDSLLSKTPTAPQQQTGTLKDAKIQDSSKSNDQKKKEEAKTGSKNSSEDAGADRRSKHYIRIKFGGDPTGKLPTEASSEPDKKTFEYMAQALKALGGDKMLISAADLAAKWENDSKAAELAQRLKALGGDKTLTSIAETINKPTTNATKPTTPNTNKSTTNTTKPTNKDVIVPDYLKTENFKTSPTTPNASTSTLRRFDAKDAKDSKQLDTDIKTGQLGLGKFDIKLEDFAHPTAKTPEAADTGPREMEFNSLKGELLGRTEVKSSSTQHNTAKFTIFDPKDEYRKILPKLKNVQITFGFVDGYSRNIFVGIVLEVGRKPPNGTTVWAVDPAYELQAPAAGTNVTSPPAASPPTDAQTMANLAGTLKLLGGDKRLISLADSLGKDLAEKEKTKQTAKTISAIDSSSEVAKIANFLAEKDALSITPATPNSKTPTPTPPTTNTTTPAKPTTGNTTSPTQPTQPTQPTTGNSDILSEIKETKGINPSLAQQFVSTTANKDLKFKDQTNGIKVEKMGEARLQQSKMAAAQTQAALKGNIVVVRGNTVVETSPGKGDSTGVILDYKGNPSTFVGPPIIKKRSPVSLQGPAGGVAVRGWNPQTKQLVEGVAYTPGSPTQHPTGVINPPEWKAVKLADPVIPGSPYTWGDATKEGARVPVSKQIMGGIIRIAVIITQLTPKTGQKKWIITSWYRDPANNADVGGRPSSRHLDGDAVDFYFDGPEYDKFFKEMWADGPDGSKGWAGGVAQGGGFIHLDDRASQGKGRARWYY